MFSVTWVKVQRLHMNRV
uniref:Uncharacterized protein n=1 Tax=Arundo donax TaxID=35708 RepID=A0A0A8Z4M2_ARUDO